MHKPTSPLSLRIVTRLGLWAIIALLVVSLSQKTPVNAQNPEPTPPPGAVAELLVRFDPSTAKLKETTQQCQSLFPAAINSGCWVSVGNVYGHDYLMNNGSLTGGCNDSKNVESQVPTTWVGTLTGNINQASGTAAFTADSTQTQKYLIDGSIRAVWKSKIILKEGRKESGTDVYSGLAEVTTSYQNPTSNVNATCTGTVNASVEIWLPLEQPPVAQEVAKPKIEIARIEDFADPANYQPFRFLVTLTEKDASGKDVRMVDKIIRVENPWKNGYFQENFEASQCYHCLLVDYQGKKIYARGQPEIFPDLYLVTDQNGQANFTLYPDLVNLWYLNKLPRQKAPLKVVFSLIYEVSPAGSQGNVPGVNKLFPVEVNSLGIVERVFYRYPTLRDLNTNETAESRRTYDLEPGIYRLGNPNDSGTNDAGTEFGGTLIGGAQRVRVRHAAPSFEVQGEKNIGDVLSKGDFLYTDDQVYLIAKNLPGDDRLGGYAPQINMQFRTWDGVRMVMTVGKRAEQGDLLIAPTLDESTLQKAKDAFSVITGKRKVDDVWAKYKKSTGMYVFSSTCEWALKKVFPAYGAVKSAGEYGSQAYAFMGYGSGDSYVVQVKSSLLVEPRADGLYLTTREGQPVLMTIAGEAIVPTGQTGIMAPGGRITVRETDPETVANADRILAEMSTSTSSANVKEPGATGIGPVLPLPQGATPTSTPTEVLWIGGVVVLLLFVLILFALFRPKKQPLRAQAPTGGSRNAAPGQFTTPPRPSAPYLRVIAGLAVQPGLLLSYNGLLIGSDPRCALILRDPHAAPFHTRLDFVNSAWLIVDLNSPTGLYVNNQRVTSSILHPGDRAQIGSTMLIFEN